MVKATFTYEIVSRETNNLFTFVVFLKIVSYTVFVLYTTYFYFIRV